MARFTLLFGIVLNIVGILGYVLSGSISATALIPSFIGDVFVILGLLVAIKPTLRKHVMHAAAALALITFLATGKGIFETISYFRFGVLEHLDKGIVKLGNGQQIRSIKSFEEAATAILCLIFVVVCVQSFITARKRRIAAAQSL